MSANQDFSLSIKYSMPLIKNASFKQSVYFLISRLTNNKTFRETHRSINGSYLDKYITILKNPKFVAKACTNSTKDGKDYRLYNLTRNVTIPLHREFDTRSGRHHKYLYGVALHFKDKYSCRTFLDDLRVRPQDVIFAAYIASTQKYEVVLRFPKGVTPKQERQLICNLNFIFNNSENRYIGFDYSTNCRIPGTIYDRWFDPFSQKVIWNANDIRKSFHNTISFSEFMSNLFILRRKLINGNCSTKSPLTHFISNINLVPASFLRENLYIVNHYINELNPYKRKDARKDWKFAAEQYLNEILGKYKYIRNNIGKELERAQELAISESTNVQINQRMIDDSKKNVENYKAKSILTAQEQYYLKTDIENIEIYTKIRNKYIDEVKESVKNRFYKNIDDKTAMYFSKKEAELFINSLNLKTKISAVKLRKLVLKKMIELNLLTIKEEYRSKVSCRKYSINSYIKDFYNIIKDKLNSFIFYINNYYMLQNTSSDKISIDSDLGQIRVLMDTYRAPPD